MVRPRSFDSFRNKYQKFFCVYLQWEGPWHGPSDDHPGRVKRPSNRRLMVEKILDSALKGDWAIQTFSRTKQAPIYRVHVTTQSDLIAFKQLLPLNHRPTFNSEDAANTLVYEGKFTENDYTSWESKSVLKYQTTNNFTFAKGEVR